MEPFSRRQFLLLSGQLGAAAMVAPRFAFAQDSEQPVKGGTLRLSQVGVPPGYDTQKWWSAQADLGTSIVNQTLISVHPYTGKRIPILATEEPTISPDRCVYIWKLRPNTKFTGGYGVMTAHDVKFSWERLMSTSLGAEAAFIYTGVPFSGIKDYQESKAKEIVGIKVIDDLTLQVTLDRPDSAYLPAFTYQHTSILPRAYYEGKTVEQVNWAPVGTGPYMVETIDKTKGVRFIRNPDYWDPNMPHADAVEIEFNVDPQLAVLRIQKGELDMMAEPIPAASLNQIRNDPNLKSFYYEAPQNDCNWMSLPVTLKPFDDVRVRKAIAMSIDKARLAKILKGTAIPATGSFFSPKSRYWEDGVALPFDPEGAKKLLSEAGFADGFEAPFWWQNQPPYTDIGPAIVEDLAQIGIRCKAEPKVYDQFVTETNPGPPAMMIYAWEDAYGHGSFIADAAFTSGAIANACCNYSRITSPELDKMVAGGHNGDLELSDKAYKDVARFIVKEQAAWVPLLYPVRCELANGRVKGYQTAVYPSGQSKRFERYWIS